MLILTQRPYISTVFEMPSWKQLRCWPPFFTTGLNTCYSAIEDCGTMLTYILCTRTINSRLNVCAQFSHCIWHSRSQNAVRLGQHHINTKYAFAQIMQIESNRYTQSYVNSALAYERATHTLSHVQYLLTARRKKTSCWLSSRKQMSLLIGDLKQEADVSKTDVSTAAKWNISWDNADAPLTTNSTRDALDCETPSSFFTISSILVMGNPLELEGISRLLTVSSQVDL